MYDIFRKYDVRGVYPKQINEEIVKKIGMGLGTMLPGEAYIVGRDVRLHSESLKNALIKGLISTGASVIDAGLLPTHVIALTCKKRGCYGVEVTASHNPKEYNGLKMFDKNGEIFDELKNKLKEFVLKGEFKKANGTLKDQDIKEYYISFIYGLFKKKLPCKVVADYANGVGGEVFSMLCKKLGIELIEINKEFDGNFPKGKPEPTEDSLKELVKKVKEVNADFGVGFDGDADRAVYVTKDGVIDGNKMFCLFADYMKDKNFVAPVFASMILEDYLGDNNVHRSATGCVNVVKKVKEVNAGFAGEPSGHWIFPGILNYFEVFYSTALLAEMVQSNQIKSLLSMIPEPCIMHESISCDNKFEKMNYIIKIFKKEYKTDLTDGVRFRTKEGVVLIRPSNTEEIIRITSESTDNDKAKKQLEVFKDKVTGIIRGV